MIKENKILVLMFLLKPDFIDFDPDKILVGQIIDNKKASRLSVSIQKCSIVLQQN